MTLKLTKNHRLMLADSTGNGLSKLVK